MSSTVGKGRGDATAPDDPSGEGGRPASDERLRSDAEWLAEVGRRLRALRRAQRRTIVDVAEAAGLGRQTVSRAESGDNPTLLTVTRLLRVYGRLDALRSFAPEPLPSPLAAIEEKKGR